MTAVVIIVVLLAALAYSVCDRLALIGFNKQANESGCPSGMERDEWCSSAAYLSWERQADAGCRQPGNPTTFVPTNEESKKVE